MTVREIKCCNKNYAKRVMYSRQWISATSVLCHNVILKRVFTSQLTVVTDGICLMIKITIQPCSGYGEFETYGRLFAEFLQLL